MLHGMGDPIKAAVRKLGLRLREYTPVGELIPGMAYFVRRLLENTANESFLRLTFAEGAAVDELVAGAGRVGRASGSRWSGCPSWRRPTPRRQRLRQLAARRLLAPENREAVGRALERVRCGGPAAGKHWPLVDRRQAGRDGPSR